MRSRPQWTLFLKTLRNEFRLQLFKLNHNSIQTYSNAFNSKFYLEVSLCRLAEGNGDDS